MAEKTATCMDKESLKESLKAATKGKACNLTLFVNNDFYNWSKAWLTAIDSSDGLSKKDVATIKRKKWTIKQGKVAEISQEV